MTKQELIIGDRVKKHVATIHKSGNLSALAGKLFNVLLHQSYDSLLTSRTHTVPVKILCLMLGFDSKNTSYLKKAVEELVRTPIQFDLMEDGEESWEIMSMLSFGSIRGGFCTFRYDEAMASKLYEPEIYAMIKLDVQNNIMTGYPFKLWENCTRYKDVGSTGWWDIERFRKLMGADSQAYDDFKILKNRIIKKSVSDVNKSSDIFLTDEYKKDGRRVVALRFLIKENPQSAMFGVEENEELHKVRTSEIYKRLLTHGISDKLAIAWLTQVEPGRIAEVIGYVEGQAEKHKIKGSTGGYIRKLVEEGANVGLSKFEQEQAEKKKAIGRVTRTIEKKEEDGTAKRIAERKAASAWFDTLPEEKRESMRLEFEAKSRENPMYAIEKGRASMFSAYLAAAFRDSKDKK